MACPPINALNTSRRAAYCPRSFLLEHHVTIILMELQNVEVANGVVYYQPAIFSTPSLLGQSGSCCQPKWGVAAFRLAVLVWPLLVDVPCHARRAPPFPVPLITPPILPAALTANFGGIVFEHCATPLYRKVTIAS